MANFCCSNDIQTKNHLRRHENKNIRNLIARQRKEEGGGNRGRALLPDSPPTITCSIPFSSQGFKSTASKIGSQIPPRGMIDNRKFPEYRQTKFRLTPAFHRTINRHIFISGFPIGREALEDTVHPLGHNGESFVRTRLHHCPGLISPKAGFLNEEIRCETSPEQCPRWHLVSAVVLTPRRQTESFRLPHLRAVDVVFAVAPVHIAVQAAFAYLMAALPRVLHLFHSHRFLCLADVHRTGERPRGMNDTTLSILFFLIHINAAVFHVCQYGAREEPENTYPSRTARGTHAYHSCRHNTCGSPFPLAKVIFILQNDMHPDLLRHAASHVSP